MHKYLSFIIIMFFVSCSQSFLEETQDAVEIKASISNNTLETGILLEWENQIDFARVEVLRGSSQSQLSIFKNRLVQTTWLDEDTMPGKDYFYRIQAYNSRDRMIGQSGVLKGVKRYKNISEVSTPTELLTYLKQYSDKIDIYWQGNVNDIYRVYRSSTSDGVYSLISEMTFNANSELVYKDTDVTPASTYYYKVATIGINDTGIIEEKYATSTLLGETKNAPTGLTASQKNVTVPGGIIVTWDRGSHVDYYQVFRSQTEDGTYQLIAPFVHGQTYVDKALPILEGTIENGSIIYPSYFYKVKSVSVGESSGFSSFGEGQAVNPVDILSAPEFDLQIDKSSYPYNLTFTWNPVEGEHVSYRIYRTDQENNIQLVAENLTGITHSIPNPPFNSRYTYTIQAFNHLINLPGFPAFKDYVSVSPAPPIIKTISTNAREYTTNMYDVNKESHVYWNNGSATAMVGTIKKEWVTTSTVGFIDITWEKQVELEDVAYYNIYRRKQGDAEFTKIKERLTALSFRDTTFTAEQYNGTGSGEAFRYPMYEYTVTAEFSGGESAPSEIEAASAINPADILPAPKYVHIPGHWANRTGFGRAKWAAGSKSPEGVDQIVGLGGVNHMYLVWADVPTASTYRVRHSRGSNQEEWYSHESTFPTIGNNRARSLYLNNESSTASMTGLYVFSDFWSYSQDSASFDVGSINANTGFLLGEVRGVWFTEPAQKPY